MNARLLRPLTTLALVLAVLVPTASATGAAAEEAAAAPAATALRTDALVDPIGIGAKAPQLSWQLDAARRGVTQSAYQVRVGTEGGTADVWDSGKVVSAQSVDVAYAGPALASHTTYHWSVRAWDDQGAASDWSPAATFETGLLKDDEWADAHWISADDGTRIGPEWTDYKVEFTASGISGALGVYFRGRDTEHAYMWQISESEKSLRPHVKNGGYTVLSATPFPAGFDFAADHRYAIEVSGTTITTTVDGTQLDRRQDSTHTAPGIIGFRTSGEETGLVHDVKVTSADGDVLVDTDFPADDRTFLSGTVTPGGLLVDATGPEAWLALGEDVPLLRKDFELPGKTIAKARIYAAAQGVYELQLNGERVGDQELAPGWTDYRKRIQYQTYDVTDQLRAGANALGAQVADGWFAGHVAMFGDHIWGDRTSLVAVLRVDYTDGSSQVVGTDDTWRTTPGPITSADLLDGESYDARRADEVGDWAQPGYAAAGWEAATVVPSATDLLEPQDDQPVRETQELSAHRLDSPDADAYIYDLDQNMVGKARVTVEGQAGQTVRIRYAEVLNKDGSLYTANLRGAKATDYYTLRGDGPETYEPTFTFHGFRYVEITGVDQAPAASDVIGVVMGTDNELVNDFETSSDLVNQLHSNIEWGQRGNFLSIPTDTPARDERMGWTGDINVFSRTAVYNMDAQAFLRKWLQDLRDTQREDGAFPGVAPVIPGRFDGGYGPAGWADAGVHVPWVVWQAYGDQAVIEENYDAMKRYVDYLDRDSTNHIRSADGYLDWLNLDDPTPADVLDTAFVARSTREFAEMAAAVGNTADATAYRGRFEAIRKAYQDAFIAEDGTVKGDSQTGYILTINNGLAPERLEKAVGEQFVETIERRDWHLSTGFLGVDGLLPALTAVGRTDVAYRLLRNEDYPSWGYEIGKGATTIWERWNSIMPDGSFGPVGMNSFNHYAYGAVGEWMYRTLAGISPAEPGYHRSVIAPEPGDGVDWARMSHQTPYGTVASEWHSTDDGMTLDVTVPGNTTAEVHVTAPNRWAVREGGKPVSAADGVRFLRMEDGEPVFEAGSGSYHFTVDRVLGHLGTAIGTTADLSALIADGSIDGDAVDYLTDQVDKLASQASDAWDSRAALDGDTAALVHRALSTTATMRRWVDNQERVGGLEPADAEAIRARLTDLDRQLSAASAELVGAVARLLPPTSSAVQGGTATATITVENRGDATLKGLGSTLAAPTGWTVAPVGTQATSVAPGETVSHEYRLSVPDDATPGAVLLSGGVEYQWQSSLASLPVSADTAVIPAVVVDSVQAQPGTAHAGEQAELQVVVRNQADEERSGAMQVSVPDGWAAVPAQDFTVPASSTSTLRVPVTVPQSVSEGPAQIRASLGDTPPEQGSTSLAVVFDNPPAGAVDHVDLGNPDSEQAHHLAASSASGTNTEAGLTRRYTNSAQPGGWFEMDLKVPTDGPVTLRMVETYDQPQTKTYDVVVDGVVVHERRYHRSEGGQGSLTYQFVLDRPDLTSDGTVRIRFQDVGADYDPSIADLWSSQ